MSIQYVQMEKRKFAIVDLKGAADLMDYLEDLEDSLEALRRLQKGGKWYSAEEIKREFLQNRIREVRSRNGLTQKQLAKKLGTTQAYISKIENPSNRPSFQSLEKVAKALKVSVEDLI